MKSPVQNVLKKKKTICLGFRLCIVVVCLGQATNSFADKGDKLIVTESIVNVRSGPSSEYESIVKLKKDREVTEIQRQENWVEIETHRDDIKTGWIHKSLLKKLTVSKNTSPLTRFDKFKKRFDDKNEVIKKQDSDIYFSEVKNRGNDQIDVIATQVWFDSNMEKRNSTVNEIFELWSNFVPVGNSMSVHVLDQQGEQYTVLLR